MKKHIIAIALGLTLSLGLTTFVQANPAVDKSDVVNAVVNREAFAQKLIGKGERYLNRPYHFGARRGSGAFDCSLFTQTVFAEMGINIGRSSRQQASQGTYVSLNNVQVGDLIFLRSYGSSRYSKEITHVAIYAGNNTLLHTWGVGGVRYNNWTGHWRERSLFAKRYF